MNGVNPNSVYRSLNPIGKKLKAKKFVKEVLSRFHKK
jgi:hypothetical protein